MADFNVFHCEGCNNRRRFLYKATFVSSLDGKMKELYALAVQEPDGIYLIRGTEEVESRRGPASPGYAHLYCAICGNNVSMPVYDMEHSEHKGWKRIEVLLHD